MIKENGLPIKIGDRTTGDVVVRIRTQEGRDEWFYCHSRILIEKSKYFADRLSEEWPTCQILDSRSCVEVYCEESEFNAYVNVLRLLYAPDIKTWYGVRNTLGILQVADRLGCRQMSDACVAYLESVPWEEADEEEILKIVPSLGSKYESILARLQPVNPSAVIEMFITTLHFATSTPPASIRDLRCSAQEQLEYMLTEDDDVPFLATNDKFRSEVKKCMKELLSRCRGLLNSSLISQFNTYSEIEVAKSFISDLSWACQIMNKVEMMKDFIYFWTDASVEIAQTVNWLNTEADCLEMHLKVVELVAKVLEAVGYGNVILPTSKRFHLVKVWLPFAQKARVLSDSADSGSGNDLPIKIESELWQNLESAFVSIMLALPSGDQAEILAEWLKADHIRYPDLSEAFETWCYRSKIAKRRLAFLNG